jgi:hypothetical protein
MNIIKIANIILQIGEVLEEDGPTILKVIDDIFKVNKQPAKITIDQIKNMYQQDKTISQEINQATQ